MKFGRTTTSTIAFAFSKFKFFSFFNFAFRALVSIITRLSVTEPRDRRPILCSSRPFTMFEKLGPPLRPLGRAIIQKGKIAAHMLVDTSPRSGLT